MKFHAINDQACQIISQGWRIIVSADTPEGLVTQVEAVSAWLQSQADQEQQKTADQKGVESLMEDTQIQLHMQSIRLENARLKVIKYDLRQKLFGAADLSDQEKRELAQLPQHIGDLEEEYGRVQSRQERLQSVLSNMQLFSKRS